MVVQHNISAMNANRYYGINNKALAGSLEKLSSGYAINRAGDNAAGLAVSEKMRAQIGGLTQASKNAEDGISLVQTMEGALQETDSILQRMRTLAVQSANGNYQDDVDRDAIQLEFDQLNDELNQIADTDFNGVVMLNGGQMADGLKAVNGKFDYANKAGQVITEARDKSVEELNTATTELNAAKAAFNSTKFDLSENGTTREYNTIDNNNYTKTEADALWEQLGLTKDGSTTVSDTNPVDTDKYHSVEITFTYDGNGKWEATKGYDQSGKKLDSANLENVTATTADASGTDRTGYGGFSVKAGDTELNVNAVFDATNAKKGDTYTIIFTNDAENTYAPKNVGFDLDSVDVNDDAEGVEKTDLAVALGGKDGYELTDDGVTSGVEGVFKALENAVATSKYTAGTETTTGEGDDAETTVSGGSVEFSLRAAGSAEGDDPYFKFDIDATSEDSTQTFTVKDENGKDVDVTAKYSAADGTVTLSAKALVTEGEGDNAKTELKDVDLMTFTIGNGKAADIDESTKDGTISAVVSTNSTNYEKSSAVTAYAGDDDKLGNSSAALDRLNKAQEKYNTAVANNRSIKDLASAKAYLHQGNVSESDTYDQSMAKMTYTDNMNLQVGARTKDIVNFTFNYNTNDLGGLKANLNCSSREDGLNTASLSVNTSKDANDAIDKIDKALNKVNMVRATFGAVQNRLEHKINNLDTTNENITAAESRIRDTQMDKEMMKFTSSQILSQASQSMLAQANSLPQGVLQLLG